MSALTEPGRPLASPAAQWRACRTELGRDADPFKLHRARREGAEPISEHTKGGPSREKANGAKLGNPRNIQRAGSIGREIQTAAADAFAAAMLSVLTAADTLDAISCALNRRKIRSVCGTPSLRNGRFEALTSR